MSSRIWRRLGQALNPTAANGETVEARRVSKRAILREIDIFRDLLPEDFRWLEETTSMATAPKGSVIYHQDDRAEGLFLLKKGRVRLYRLSASGKKLELALLGPGTFFGEMPLMAERMRNTTAEAAEDCTLCVLSRADIERLILRRPQVALAMLDVVSRRLAEAETRLEDLAYRSVPARLAAALLRLASPPEDTIAGLTHQDLGDMVGAYRETVTKTLDEFQMAGYVELGRRRIRLLDRAGLAGLLED